MTKGPGDELGGERIANSELVLWPRLKISDVRVL